MNDIKWDYINGDVAIAEDTDNIIQAILNRLNTDTDELDYLYDNYGCDLRQFLGLPADDTTLEMVKNVISDTLKYDERLTLMDMTLSYKDTSTLNILLTCTYDDNAIDMDLLLSENGVELNG